MSASGMAQEAMTPYPNLGGRSGIRAYRIEPAGIVVEFRTGRHLRYGYIDASAGAG